MKKIFIKDKFFKVIPEANLVMGEMPEKWIGRDVRRGIKPIYKAIIVALAQRISDYDVLDYPNICANAYCDKNDVFDEKIGIEVCSAKMEWKNHMKLAKLYDRMHRILIETAVIVGTWCAEHTKKAQSIEDDLVRTYGRMPK